MNILTLGKSLLLTLSLSLAGLAQASAPALPAAPQLAAKSYVLMDAASGKVVIATKKAVTLFNKKGVEVEQNIANNRSEDAANKRENYIFSRKYYLAALTDESKDVKVFKGTATAATEETVNASKTYYAKSGVGYVKVTPASGDNPKTKGWFTIA